MLHFESVCSLCMLVLSSHTLEVYKTTIQVHVLSDVTYVVISALFLKYVSRN